MQVDVASCETNVCNTYVFSLELLSGLWLRVIVVYACMEACSTYGVCSYAA